MNKRIAVLTLVGFLAANSLAAYPIDGYETTGLRRLEAVRLRVEKQLPGAVPASGALKPIADIKLHLCAGPGHELKAPPEVDADLQQQIEALFPNRDESYSIAILAIMPDGTLRFAARQEERQFQPGSVGKLAVAAGLFAELKRLFPSSPEARQKLLRERMVVADRWIRSDTHEVPLFDPATLQFIERPIQEGDVFSLYEWTDHMLSASANAAASVVWKEAVLMRAFGENYPPTYEAEVAYFKQTPVKTLQAIASGVVNDVLREMGIDESQWRLGSFFTSAGKAIIPMGGSHATPSGFLLFLMRIEQGLMVDEWSSLELKRLMYMTAKRIRYASAPALAKSMVYFKSGSLYKCQAEPGFNCGKYKGNVYNYMNSVAIVERPDGVVYLVALMSNVLRKNSAVDHQTLATQIDRVLQ